jgi:hypothetical protein
VLLSLEIQAQSGKMMKDFVVAAENHPQIQLLKKEVESFATLFPFPDLS